jgi:N-formylglutamate amidohydrolase
VWRTDWSGGDEVVDGLVGVVLEEGAHVLVTGHARATLDAARDKLGGGAIVVDSDTASLSGIDTLADRVKTEFRRAAPFRVAACHGVRSARRR